jgi:hypothetical protein
MIIENIVKLTENQESFITWAQGPMLPWLFNETTSKQHMYFHHPLKIRGGQIISPYYDVCYSIFEDFCKENNVPFKEVLRASINNTYHHPQKMNKIHVDHSDIPHGNFIMYMNTFDEGYTYFFDDEENLIHTTIPEKNKGVVFINKKHAQGFCAPNQNRFVLVFTFTLS